MAKTTKDEIIAEAIQLFNKYGLSEISMRDIADACNISVGNLTYHFHRKKDLILAIVEAHQNERSTYPSFTDMDFVSFMKYLKIAEKLRCKYSFYYDNFVDISRMYKEISIVQSRVHMQVIKCRHDALCSFQRLGLIRDEQYPGQYNDMATGTVMITSFWNHHVTLTDRGPEEYAYLNKVVWSMMIPCMTEKGYQIYQSEIIPLIG